MEKLLIDENGEYGLDCTQAVWASDKMHEDYHRAKVQLSDADFLPVSYTHLTLPTT